MLCGGCWAVYLTEQQIQPFPTSIHSVTSWPAWLTVRGFSMSVAVFSRVLVGLIRGV